MYVEPLNVRYYVLIMLVPLLGINLIRNLKLLVPFSKLANVITFVGLGIVLWYIFKDLPPISSRPLVGEPRNYTLFVGMTLFAVEAFGVVSRSAVMCVNSRRCLVSLKFKRLKLENE